MKKLLIWLAYFLIIAFVAMPLGSATQLVEDPCDTEKAAHAPCMDKPLTPLATNADIIRVFFSADAAYIAKKAKAVADANDWHQLSLWPLWPPGMLVLEAALYKLSPDLPVALALIVITSSLWAAVFTGLACMLRAARIPGIVAFMLPLPILLTAELINFMHMGLFYTESYSIAFFLLGAGALMKAVTDRSYHGAVSGGVLFALSAYLRAQTDMIMTIATGFMVVYCASRAVIQYCNSRTIGLKHAFAGASWLAVFAVALMSYHVVTMPYRAAHQMQWIGFSQNPTWYSVWQRPEEMPPVLKFMEVGGITAGCTVDPQLCDTLHASRLAGDTYTMEDYKRFTIQTALHHPVKWLAFKLPYLITFWFQGLTESSILTALLVYVLIYYPFSTLGADKLAALILVSATLGIIGPLLLVHVEPRYLYHLRLLILYTAFSIPSAAHPRKIMMRGPQAEVPNLLQ